MSDKKIIDRYTEISSSYKRRLSLINFLFLRKLRKKLIGKANGKILEIATGSGANFPFYSKYKKITAIDLTPSMLKIAKTEARKFNLRVDFKIADTEKLPFKSNSFDSIIDSLGLCTYNAPIKALKEMKRVCKKGGAILLLEHGQSNRSFILKIQKLREKYFYKKKCCRLTREHVLLANKSGLKISHQERHFFGIIYFIVAKP